MAKIVECPYKARTGCKFTATDAADMRTHIIQAHGKKTK